MWRTSGKLSTCAQFSRRKVSVLKQSSVRGGNSRTLKATRLRGIRHSSTEATGGRGGSGAGKIVAGVTVIATGTALGGLYYANKDPAFRKTVEDKFPFIAPLFNAVIGRTDSEISSHKAVVPSLPDKAPRSHNVGSFSDVLLKPEVSTKEIREDKPVLPEASDKKLSKEVKQNIGSAAVSSVDQIAVSSVDLDISNTVEKHVSEANVAVDSAGKETEKTSKDVKKGSVGGVKKKSKKKKLNKEKEENKEVKKEDNVQDEKSKVSPEESKENPKVVSDETNAVPKEATVSMETAALDVALQTAIATVSELGHKVIDGHERAIAAVRLHRDSVREALENAEKDIVSRDQWEVLGTLSETKVKALEDVEHMAAKLDDLLEKVRIDITKAKEKGLEASAEVASETLAKLTYALQQAKNHLRETQSEGTVMKQFQDYIEEGKQHLKEQLASIRPEFHDTKPEDKADEALLAYAQKRIRLLEDTLEQRENDERKLIENALHKQQREHEKLANMRLKHELEKLRNELNDLMRQKEAATAEQHENDLRQQLRRQAAAFGDHLNEVLKVQANELDAKHQSEMREKLMLARQEFDLKLHSTLARLNGVIAAVQNRADVEKHNSEAQELWLACQSLSTAITVFGNDRPRLCSIRNEVETIRRITHGNEVVDALLDSLPEAVLQRGLFPEESLRRRFPFVRKVCKQVAMVSEEGGGVWSHLLSYFQSLLVFDVRAVKHPTAVNPDNLDTYEILSLAASSLEDGDTEQAVRYMNQLRGEPRRVAIDWIQEARLFLETRQVARFLTSFASAYNIGAHQQK